ncbi:site-specific integrase [Microvirga calopogonii]|uniref:site-specific integrase n=1 Tax=Microvirga calopogonii TaxID=2078013 RepID=UPI000E0D66AD|nr:site-specific integrase [Microvirga calopogonii]
MADQRLTKKVVDGIKPNGAEFTVWDSDLTGFGVRVRSNGAMSYVVVYRVGNGRKAPVKKLTIGTVGKLTPDEARGIAKKAIGSVAHGLDPAAEKAEARKCLTVSELADAFLTDHVRTKRKGTTAEGYEHALKAHVVPELGSTKADKLTRPAVAKLHLKLQDRPAMANYVLAVIGSMYGFAQRRGFVPEGFNPASRIEKYPEQGRERFLTSDELARLGDAIREAETIGIAWEVDESKPTAKHAPKAENRRTVFGPYPVAALRLLLLTGCRLREVLHLKWEYVDFERGMIFLPDSKTGRKPVVLNAPALAVLASLPRAGAYVVLGDDPERPRHDLKKIWAAVSRHAGLAGVRIHDLRHTFASIGAGGGLGLPIVGKLLGHTQAATTARYAHLDADPLRRASDRIAGTIAAALEGRPEAEVVPLKTRQS